MNTKRILFSAIVTAIVGAGVGILLTEIKPYYYPDRSAHQSPLLSAIVGIVVGFLSGAAQESVRELKMQQDQEEKLRNYLNTYLQLRDIDKEIDK